MCWEIATSIIVIGWILGWRIPGNPGQPGGPKAQWVRLLDVVFIGPIMIYAGSERGDWIGLILILLGAATMSFNLRNFCTLQHPIIVH